MNAEVLGALLPRPVLRKGTVGDADGIESLERNRRITEGSRHLLINLGDHETRRIDRRAGAVHRSA